MYMLRRMIGRLGNEELNKLKKDIEEGGFELQRIIEEKIKHHESTHEKTCSVCYNDLGPFSVHNYTLVFGPDDFRKKASFCGMDCLQYFLDNLKNMREE